MHVPSDSPPQAPAATGIRPQPDSLLQVVANAAVPTAFGNFEMIVFRWAAEVPHDGLSPDHVALVMGEVDGADNVLVRIHSECLTSEVFGSLKCDCREQLQEAQRRVAEAGCGAILYLRQEGRGIGLANKIRAYDLQAQGHDTVDANRILGLPDDARQYHQAAAMIRALGIRSVRLMTNNPDKVQAMRELGVNVVAREPHVMLRPNAHAVSYLETKRKRMGHALPTEE